MIRKISLLLILTTSFTQFSFAQETIEDQFKKFYDEETSTWQEYKLVKMPKLQNFWKVVSDTVRTKNEEIGGLKNEISALNTKVASVQDKLLETERMLAESESLNDSISFVGVPISKPAYNVMVWGIIAVLAVGIGLLYVMYMRSNKITAESKEALESIDQELKDHKDRARETQAKLKRELQTALNTIHENRLNH